VLNRSTSQKLAILLGDLSFVNITEAIFVIVLKIKQGDLSNVNAASVLSAHNHPTL
jgi:hypothetical protein